jgi:lysophospholipase L1-like esterase
MLGGASDGVISIATQSELRMRVETIVARPSFADLDRRADAGERLTIAFLGGSLTWGANASDPQRTGYRALVGNRFTQAYPHAHFKFVDAAIGGTGAQLGLFRLDRDVLRHKPDLLFLDFTVNDGIYATSPDTLAAHEAIVRRMIGEAPCPVIQMIIAVRESITHSTATDMKFRSLNRDLAFKSVIAF